MNELDSNARIEDLRQRLKSRDHKMTPARQEILKIFDDRPGQHLSAEDVHDYLREKQSNIGLATVYRSLELLTEIGLLTRLEFGDGRARFEINSENPHSHHHHHHLVCLKCRKVFEFGDDLLEPLENDIAEKSGFKIINHDLKFYGYCRECQP